ncbi:hypothetical protein E2562_010150 [Oryza meyeriana var. granulata]|uniref:DUF6598 domain-containing protein n=1 Tax=Oryza meyeriana var. granulata TaxID=110450 RepID=A0A6G1EKL7_9ORYZ|nr:hypothetical protein E2562_010150 [Oryza meyeriana var. granulata]
MDDTIRGGSNEVVVGGDGLNTDEHRVAAVGEDLDDAAAVLLPRAGEDGELDVTNAEAGLAEDATDDEVIEDGEDELRELDLDGGRGLRGGGLVVEVEGVLVVALVVLGVLDGCHEGVGDRRLVGRGGRIGGDRGEPIEGDGEAERLKNFPFICAGKGGRVLGKRRETGKPQDEEDEADLDEIQESKSSSSPSVEKVWRLSDMEKLEGFPESIGMSAEEYAASMAKAAAESKLWREELPEDWEARVRKRWEDEAKAYREMMGSEDEESWSAIQYRKFWNDVYSRHHGSYEDTTRIPPMRFTHKSSLDWRARTLDTLQVFSVKVAATSGGLQWPLDVFGMVSMRDSVDRNRNVVFHRTRDNCQTLTEQATISVRVICGSWPDGFCGQFAAFTTGVWFKHLAREGNIASIEHAKIVLLDCRGERVVTGDGKIELSRCVVSVENKGELKVSVKAWKDDTIIMETEMVFTALEAGLSDGEKVVVSGDGKIELSRRVVSVEKIGELKVSVKAWEVDSNVVENVVFTPLEAGLSNVELDIGFCKLEISVAWSLISENPVFVNSVL